MHRKYRTLQPAPGSPGPGSGEGGSGAAGGPQRPSQTKRSTVPQACDNCKQAKAKCSGGRPVCQRCSVRGLACSYSKEQQKQQHEAMKARLETLEELFSTLQTQSPEEAHRIVQSIRSSGGVSGASPSSPSPPSISSSGPTSSSAPSSNPQDQAQGLSLSSRTENTNEKTGDAFSVAQSGRPRPDAASFGLPDAEVTTMSLTHFYDSSGPLFHVFSRSQAMALCARVYDPTRAQDASESMEVDVACVAAIASVGAQYMNGSIDVDLYARLYDISRHNFESVVEQRPYDAIKICALLAMFNIMNKVTTAITYVEIGLSMARMQGVDWPLDSSQKTPALIACKTAWRTLMFFSCWLSSTLGYISGNDIWFGRLPLSAFNADDPSDLHDVVQAEMTKISMLKARILQTQMNFKEQSILSLETMMQELQDWHGNLPEPLHLAKLVEQGHCLPNTVWVSVCHTHLLYLGAIMLLHRRTVFQCMETNTQRVGDYTALLPDRKLLIERSGDGVTAAKHSATIMSLLLERKTLFQRCWLVISQSYTSCTALLHAVSQKQIHNFPKSEWSADLEQGNTCLSVLEFCGGLDPVAYRFRERLANIYAKLARFEQLEGASLTLEQEHRDNYLFLVPEDAPDEQKTVSWTLLNLLCKPFTGPSDRVNFAECPYKREHSFYTHLMEQLQWKYESTNPFNWDVHSLVGCDIGGVNNEQQGHRFLESTQPNFWRSGPSFQR